MGHSLAFQITILASGSSGNAALVETERTRLLLDAGLSCRETLRRLKALGRRLDRLDGILLTHEHTDHSGGLPALFLDTRATVHLTEATHCELERVLPEDSAKVVDRVEYIRPGQRFTLGDIDITAFSVPHDAADPVAFTFRAAGRKLALVTDLGYLPELVKQHLRESDCLILESNHDIEMLKVGPYPWPVKQRVMSRTGHLSNHAVSEFLSDPDSFDGGARYLVLAHLSERNNTPELARISAEEALNRRPAPSGFGGELLVASQRVPLGPIAF